MHLIIDYYENIYRYSEIHSSTFRNGLEQALVQMLIQ